MGMKSFADLFKSIQKKQLDAALTRQIAEEEAAFLLKNKKRYDRSDLVKSISNHIDFELHRGKMPLYKVHGAAQRNWIAACISKMADDFDLWEGLVAWLRNEGLAIKVSDGWSGDGSSAWTEVSVGLLPGPEIEAD